MISYVLGGVGEGKTSFFLDRHSRGQGVYFAFLSELDSAALFSPLPQAFDDSCALPATIDCTALYRKMLDDAPVFKEKMLKKIKEAIKMGAATIFLDEIQLYFCDEISRLIFEEKEIEWVIIHQYPDQLGEYFRPLWNASEKRYVFNPLPHSGVEISIPRKE